jgi:hypothetical protein
MSCAQTSKSLAIVIVRGSMWTQGSERMGASYRKAGTNHHSQTRVELPTLSSKVLSQWLCAILNVVCQALILGGSAPHPPTLASHRLNCETQTRKSLHRLLQLVWKTEKNKTNLLNYNMASSLQSKTSRRLIPDRYGVSCEVTEVGLLSWKIVDDRSVSTEEQPNDVNKVICS